MKNLLFITWDSGQSNYLESLFLPIFKGLQDSGKYRCHIMQFSWANPDEVSRIQNLTQEMEIKYEQHQIHRKPIAAIGALWGVYMGLYHIKNYINLHDIEILMPRAIMPAMMVNRLWNWLKRKHVAVVFDADGLPIEERVDFAGMTPNGKTYRFLKSEESRLLKRVNRVLVRTQRAKDIHLARIGVIHEPKFHIVVNGRDHNVFRRSEKSRIAHRTKLGISPDDKLFVYTGSLGPQYAWEEMLGIFHSYHNEFPSSRFMVLTRHLNYLNDKIPEDLKPFLQARSCAFEDIPGYLSAADIAFNLRQPAPSLAGIAPIKLGEYLLTGLPVIASKGVGDTESLLEGRDFCYLFDHNETDKNQKTCQWIKKLPTTDPEKIRNFAKPHFSLPNSIQGYLTALDRMVK